MRPTSERFFIGFGALSLFFASGVVLTGMVFPSLLLNPRRLFSHIIFCISMCDMFTGIACAFGYPPPESLLCPIQGFMTIFFPGYHSITVLSVFLTKYCSWVVDLDNNARFPIEEYFDKQTCSIFDFPDAFDMLVHRCSRDVLASHASSIRNR